MTGGGRRLCVHSCRGVEDSPLTISETTLTGHDASPLKLNDVLGCRQVMNSFESTNNFLGHGLCSTSCLFVFIL